MELPDHIFTVQEQTRLFLGSILLGLPIGILLDCFRLLRALLPHHAVAVFLEDTLFVGLSVLMLQCYAAMFSRGELRFYEVLGALLGLTLYLLTIGAVWMRMLYRIRTRLQKLRSAAFGFLCQIRQKIRAGFVAISKRFRKKQKISENT